MPIFGVRACPKVHRHDMTKEWSISNTEKGARTVEGISSKSKLWKKNAERHNCARAPMFDFIPMDHVIDLLHLFLRIADVLISMLIRNITILDGINTRTCSNSDKNTTDFIAYESFLNEVCHVQSRLTVVSRAAKESRHATTVSLFT